MKTRKGGWLRGIVILGSVTLSAGLFDWGPKLEKSFASLTHSELRSAYGFVEYPPLVTYINSIGEPIGKASHRKGITYRYHVVRMPVENAFATGAGYQYITTGMLEMSDTGDELAGILAHETAHNADKHVIQSLKDQFGVMALYLSLSEKMSEDQQILFGVLANLRSLRYSRKDEYKADELGTRYMADAGFNPRYFVTSFQKLELAHPTGRMSKLEVSFSSHPRTTDRIQRINGFIENIEKDPSSSYALGMKLYERGYILEAQSYLQSALQANPDHLEAKRILGQIEASLKSRASDAGTPGTSYVFASAMMPTQESEVGTLASTLLQEEGPLALRADRDRSDMENAMTTLDQAGSSYHAFSPSQKEFFGIAAQAERELEALHAQDRAVLMLARKTRRMLEKTKEIPTLSPKEISEYARCIAEVTANYRQEEVPEAPEISGMITAFYPYSRSIGSTVLLNRYVSGAREKRQARQKWVHRAYVCSANALAYRISDLLFILYEERPEDTLRYLKTAGLTGNPTPESVSALLGSGDATKRFLASHPSARSAEEGDPISQASDPQSVWAYLNLVFGDLFRMYAGPQFDADRTMFVRVKQG
ncbi:MAG: M48 family metalloprotease [bacterium JZ-2024 1]